MRKLIHEIRDPIHGFIKVSDEERSIIDTKPLQRLRDIHQLALTYLIYPSATHKRFEHSLGVMEMAGKLFDVITSKNNIHHNVKELLPEIENENNIKYWRNVLRVSALCHDIGHLPFSHASEKELFPEDYSHERMTAEIIKNVINKELQNQIPPLRIEHVIKIAIGPEEMSKFEPEIEFSRWETILSEIIVNDVLGVDRMDYLLRDSHHLGVAYGKYDHFRLLDTIRILIDNNTGEPKLGIEEGGLKVAESLLFARYFMFSQVYLHPIRRIYDIHLRKFLKAYLEDLYRKNNYNAANNEGIYFPTEPRDFIEFSDSKILSELYKSSEEQSIVLKEYAKKILKREHYRVIYDKNISNINEKDKLQEIYEKIKGKFGTENVIKDEFVEERGTYDFPVIDRNEIIHSSINVSEVLQKIPRLSRGYIFIHPDFENEAVDLVKKYDRI